VLSTALVPNVAFAQSVLTSGRIIQTVISLVAVCALAVVALKLLAQKQSLGNGKSRLLKVEERLVLSSDAQLLVVVLGASERALMCVDQNGARILARLTKDDELVWEEVVNFYQREVH